MVDRQKQNGSRIKLGQTGVVEPGHALIEEPFPEARSLLWRPKAAGGPPAPALLITQEAFLAVNRHVAETLERELGGFLLGNRYRCPNSGLEYVIIDQFSEAKFIESNEVRLSFTLDAWAQLGDELSGKFYGKLLVGWYHSHPRMDVFLSAFDVAIHEERFAEPWMTALVIEPETKRGGFFGWWDGRLNPRDPVEFYELFGRNAEASVVDWTNYTCGDPRAARRAASGSLSGPASGSLSRSEPLAAPDSAPEAHAAPAAPAQSAPATGRQVPGALIAVGALVALGVAVAGIGHERILSALGGSPPTHTSAPGEERSPAAQDSARPLVRRATATLADGRVHLALTVRNAPANPAVQVNGQRATSVNAEPREQLNAVAPAGAVVEGDVVEVSVVDADRPGVSGPPVLVAVTAPRQGPPRQGATAPEPGQPVRGGRGGGASDPLYSPGP